MYPLKIFNNCLRQPSDAHRLRRLRFEMPGGPRLDLRVIERFTSQFKTFPSATLTISHSVSIASSGSRKRSIA